MMQKVLIRVTMVDQKKSRIKAMQIAATVSGVESVAIKGDDKDQLEIIVDGIDTVELAKLLRKKVGCADLLSVGPAKEEKPKEPAAAAATTNKNEAPTVPMQVWAYPMPPSPYLRDHRFPTQLQHHVIKVPQKYLARLH